MVAGGAESCLQLFAAIFGMGHAHRADADRECVEGRPGSLRDRAVS